MRYNVSAIEYTLCIFSTDRTSNTIIYPHKHILTFTIIHVDTCLIIVMFTLTNGRFKNIYNPTSIKMVCNINDVLLRSDLYLPHTFHHLHCDNHGRWVGHKTNNKQIISIMLASKLGKVCNYINNNLLYFTGWSSCKKTPWFSFYLIHLITTRRIRMV